jgi:cytoplasmic iron level regulating protein YaaA (DUF328/UPF0246 family)
VIGLVETVASRVVRVLLPPSEGKASGGRGRPLASRIETGPLAEPRAMVLAALQTLLAGEPGAAATALLLPTGVAADALAVNARVAGSATMPALRRYAGVVYDGLDHAHLPSDAQRLVARSTLIFSGLLGVVRGDEPVPNYRVPAKAVLPGIGVVGTFWRPVLDLALPAMLGRHLVVDLRSSDYASMGRARGPHVVTVRVLSPLPGGGLGVVSYRSKFAKGQLLAALGRRAAAGDPVESVEDVAHAWLAGADGRRCETTRDGSLVIFAP